TVGRDRGQIHGGTGEEGSRSVVECSPTRSNAALAGSGGREVHRERWAIVLHKGCPHLVPVVHHHRAGIGRSRARTGPAAKTPAGGSTRRDRCGVAKRTARARSCDVIAGGIG